MPKEAQRASAAPGRRAQTAPPVAARLPAARAQRKSSATLALAATARSAVVRDHASTTRSAYFGIGKVDDPPEHEASAVAERVMRIPADRSVISAPPPIGRRPSTAAARAPSIVDEVLHSPGVPLDADARAVMEPRFGRDFGAVRVHADRTAARSAEDLHARAYAAGNDLVFGSGRFSPGSPAGQALLAHELTHVVQQGGDSRVIQRSPDDDDDDDAEAATEPGPPKPFDLTASVYQTLRGRGMLTQEELDKLADDLTDPELKQLQAEEEAADAKKRAKEIRDEATRYQRLTRLKLVLQQKEYVASDVRDMLDKHLSMRDLLILKRFGLVFPTNWFTRGKIRKRVIAAVEEYEQDWEGAHRGSPELQEEFTKYDEFRKLVDEDTARARAAFDAEVLESIEGGIFGAIGYGIGGDEGAKLGAAIDGLLFSTGSTVEHRSEMPHSSPVRRDDPIADVRPLEQAPSRAPEGKTEQAPPPAPKPPAPTDQPPPTGTTTTSGAGAPPKPTQPVVKESKRAAPLDAKGAIEAKRRVEQVKTELHEASKEQADAEHRQLSAEARVKAAKERIKPGQPPPRLRSAKSAILKEEDLNDRLDAVREIRESRTDWSAEEKEWLDSQVELLDAQLDVEGASTGQTQQKDKARDARIMEPVRQKELARASKPVSKLIRSRGPNYRMVSKVKFDEVMGEKAWIAFKAKRPANAPPLALNTDHIVPVREIRDNVVKSGLLELYEKASPAAKAEIEKALQDLGDERDNLTRMESEANQTTKKDRLWTEIKDHEVASLYTAEMATAMRTKEGKLKEHYKKVIQALVARFSK